MPGISHKVTLLNSLSYSRSLVCKQNHLFTAFSRIFRPFKCVAQWSKHSMGEPILIAATKFESIAMAARLSTIFANRYCFYNTHTHLFSPQQPLFFGSLSLYFFNSQLSIFRQATLTRLFCMLFTNSRRLKPPLNHLQRRTVKHNKWSLSQ